MPVCKYCQSRYKPDRPMQPGRVCNSIDCQTQHALVEIERRKAAQSRQKAKTERQQYKEQRERLKTRSDWIKEAQIAFNAYIRERDKNQRCICCDKPLQSGSVGGEYDCGHYRSVGSAPNLRFDERNAHGQRKQCNRYGSGRAVDYRIGLIRRLGMEAVEALESDNDPRKWTIEELKTIRDEYRAKLRTLRQQK